MEIIDYGCDIKDSSCDVYMYINIYIYDGGVYVYIYYIYIYMMVGCIYIWGWAEKFMWYYICCWWLLWPIGSKYCNMDGRSVVDHKGDFVEK